MAAESHGSSCHLCCINAPAVWPLAYVREFVSDISFLDVDVWISKRWQLDLMEKNKSFWMKRPSLTELKKQLIVCDGVDNHLVTSNSWFLNASEDTDNGC